MLSPEEISAFERDGYVALRGAVSPEIIRQCAHEIWEATGCDPHDPATWNEPVVRLMGLATPPFAYAANSPVLCEAYNQLVGIGRWTPRTSIGTIPVRFPSDAEPGDDGWHVEASYVDATGAPRVDLGSRGRALLMLFLFSEIGDQDAPTRLRVGSHLDAPRFLADSADQSLDWMDLCQAVAPASRHREIHYATGAAGDVFLCHPFIVHAAQPHHGNRPRLMGQPPLEHQAPFDLEEATPPPVVRSIHTALRRAADIR
jgi:hypothetical protein